MAIYALVDDAGNVENIIEWDGSYYDADTNRPDDWEAPGAALVRSAATDVVPPLADLGRVHLYDWLEQAAGTLGRTYASEMDRHYR